MFYDPNDASLSLEWLPDDGEGATPPQPPCRVTGGGMWRSAAWRQSRSARDAHGRAAGGAFSSETATRGELAAMVRGLGDPYSEYVTPEATTRAALGSKPSKKQGPTTAARVDGDGDGGDVSAARARVHARALAGGGDGAAAALYVLTLGI